jgi:hypothetical protein
MSKDQENNSIEQLPELDKRLIKDWNSSRPTIEEIQGNSQSSNNSKELEKINLRNDEWRKRTSKARPETSVTQQVDPIESPGNEKNSSSKTAKKEPVNLEEALPETASLPAHIAKKYLEVNGKFYFGNKADKLAFVDKGTKLTTNLVNRDIASNFIDIAGSRGWTKLEAKGKQDFKREIWLEGSLKGIDVQGFRPKEVDYAELKKRGLERPSPAKKTIPESDKTAKPSAENEKPTSSKQEKKQNPEFDTLIKHGAAPYQNNPDNTQSYFATLENTQGKERTVWGKEIEQTLNNSNIKTGDRVKLTKGNKTAVTVQADQLDAQGKKIGTKDIQTHKNSWRVVPEEQDKKNQSDSELIRTKDREDILETNPDLKNEVIALHVADQFKKRSTMSQVDGKRFFEQVRETIARKTANGQTQPEIKIQEERQTTEKEKAKQHESER